MKPATSLCCWRTGEGTMRWTNVSPTTAISTDTAITNRPGTILITANLSSYLPALTERTDMMSAKDDSLTHPAILGCFARGCQREDERSSRKHSRIKPIARRLRTWCVLLVPPRFLGSGYL